MKILWKGRGAPAGAVGRQVEADEIPQQRSNYNDKL